MSPPRVFRPLTWTVIIWGNLLNSAAHYFNTESLVGAPGWRLATGNCKCSPLAFLLPFYPIFSKDLDEVII